MAGVKRFEDLDVWKEARALTSQVYRISRRGEFARDFGLRDQMQRAAVSVMSNVAEGFGGRTSREYVQFLGYARRSASEVQSQLYVALDLGYISQSEFDDVYAAADSCSRQLYGFIRYLKSQPEGSRIKEPPTGYEPDS
jgi:four helix bundle protein